MGGLLVKKPKDEIVKTTIRVSRSLWDKVRITAIQRGTSAEALVAEALTDLLKGAK